VGAAERWFHDKETVQEEEELVTVRGIAGTGRDLPAMRSGAAKGKRRVAVLGRGCEGWGGVFCWLCWTCHNIFVRSKKKFSWREFGSIVHCLERE
jgi:hypothetical protein